MPAPLIDLEAIDFAYAADRPVLGNASLRLAAGERVGLSGPTGSGKTTLLHLMVGLLRPTAGRLVAFGSERRTEDDFYEVRCRAGLLFQDADDQLFCPTVLEDVAFGPLNLGVPREEARRRVAGILERLELAGYEHRITDQLSGGDKRLVALAAVLAMEPEVLLLDEPTTGLDAHFTARLTEILVALPQAMLIVSHDRDFLAATATRRIRLFGGSLREDGPF